MATPQSRLFSLFGSKLGLQSEIVIKKARELHRLLQLKTSTCAVNISETCQIVICMDLSASVIGVPFEKLVAVRLAGVTKKNYVLFRHTIEKLLGIGKCVAVRDLCVQFGVSEAGSLAQKILNKVYFIIYICSYMFRWSTTIFRELVAFMFNKYVSEDAHGMVADLSHPMYSVAAVIAACKLKVDRAKLLEMSRIQKSSFLKLANAFERYAEELNPNTMLSSRDIEEDKYNPASLLKKTKLAAKDSGTQEFPPHPSRSTPDTCNLQSYEDWKRSILEDCDDVEV